MYLRTAKRKNKDGSVVEYYQLAHNKRHPKTRKTTAKIIHSFGRADEVDRDEMVRLCTSIARICNLDVNDPLETDTHKVRQTNAGIESIKETLQRGVEIISNRSKESESGSKLFYKELEKKVKAIENETAKSRQTEDELRESEVKLKTIFDTANDLIVLTDVNGNFVEVNDKMEDLFGFSRERTLGINITELVTLTSEDLKKAREGFRNAIKGKPNSELQLMEMELLRKDKSKRYVEANTKPVIKDGEIKGFVSVIRDITDRKQAETELERYRNRLEELVQDRTDELTNVNQQLKQEIAERSQAEKMLLKFSGELEKKVKERTANLEEVNTALKVLLKRREEDKVEIEEKMLINVKELVLPFLEKLNNSRLDEKQKAYIGIMEFNLNDIISPFVKELSSRYLNLTATEIRIANIIKQGKSTKEIAGILDMSVRTVDIHRYNIRKKLGLNNKKASLVTYLSSLK